MKTIKNKRGISLIVLVITIIVMIILAAAIILSLNGSGILSKANEAVTKSDEANTKYVVALAKVEWDLMSKKEKEDAGNNLKKYIEDKLKAAGIKDVKVNDKGEIVKSTYTIYTDSAKKTAPIPNGFTVSTISGETTIDGGLVIYEGTTPVTDVDSDSNGIIDAQETRNQFVWVPVDDITKFKRTTTYDGTITDPGDTYEEPGSVVCWAYSGGIPAPRTLSLADDLTGEWKEEADMRKSVQKYGGFYIGRYEAGTSIAREDDTEFGTTDVLIQRDKPVYDHVGWGQNMSEVAGEVIYANAQGKGAVQLSRELCDTNSVKSTLTYGVQWDAALIFISKTDSSYATDSTNKGNYEDTLENTGYYAINNIYDMAGNAEEWTMETDREENEEASEYRVIRGGKEKEEVLLPDTVDGELTPGSYLTSDNSTTYGITLLALPPGISGGAVVRPDNTVRCASYRRSVALDYPCTALLGCTDNRDFSSYGFRPSLYLK